MPTRSESSKKTAEKLLAKDPDFYKRIGKKGSDSRSKRYYHFTDLQNKDPEKLKQLASQGGKKSKRGNNNEK
jgi:general stress protein YciG